MFAYSNTNNNNNANLYHCIELIKKEQSMNKEYCMKNRCNGCKNYGICFNYKPKMKREDNRKIKKYSIFDNIRQKIS